MSNKTKLCTNCGDRYVDADAARCCLAPSMKRGYTMEEAIELLRSLPQREQPATVGNDAAFDTQAA